MIDFTPPKRLVTAVFLHCSASDNPDHDDVSVIRQWHLANGWSDVGYHFFIKKDGTIQPGRDLERIPAAQAPHNLGTIAMCAHGLAKENFTDVQLAAVKGLCDAINRAYEGRVTFHGHCEVANKACPVFDYRALLGLDAKGNMPLNQ